MTWLSRRQVRRNGNWRMRLLAFVISGEAIFMIMLGGITVFLGPVVGAVMLLLMTDIAPHPASDRHDDPT